MSDNEDYKAGYRGGQFHHGMDRIEYERGKAEKENIDAIGRMAGGGQKTEVPGVAFTLLLIAPLIWMVYPILGLTLLAVFCAVAFAVKMLNIHIGIGIFGGFILCVMSFFLGAKLEYIVSQFTIYRWIRGILRIIFAFVFTVAFGSGADLNSRSVNPEPGAIVGGFFVAVIAYLIFQRMDLIYFPARAEIKKMQEKIQKGERPTRSILKRMFFGLCWFIPVMMILNLAINISVRLSIEDTDAARKAFYGQYTGIIFCVNAAIWYVLCLIGLLPGTGKYMFSKEHEEDLRQMETSKKET